jgi:glycosyltransferase involved in cell wall biosynthesis
MTRIGFLVGQLGLGGAERQVYLICTALQQIGALPFVLTFNPEGVWRAHLEQAGIPIIAIPRRGSYDFQRTFILRKELVAQKLDILFCFGSAESFYGRLAGINLPVQVIPNLRSNDWGSPRDLWVDKILSPFTTGYVANSAAGKKYIRDVVRVPETKIHLIPNAIDREAILSDGAQQFDPRPPGDSENEIWCGWIGSFTQLKDPFLLVEIATITRSVAPQLHYLVVGDGPDREKVDKIARQKGLLSHLHFTGEIENASRVWKYLDFGLSTSLVEGTPNVLLEAMVWGRPYISPPVGDFPYWIKDGINGLLSPKRNPDEMASLAIQLANNSDLRKKLSGEAKRTGESIQSPDQIGQEYLSLCRKLIAAKVLNESVV